MKRLLFRGILLMSILLLGVLFILFLTTFLSLKEAKPYGSIYDILTKQYAIGESTNSLLFKYNLCFFEGWCGSYITSPYFPYVKLQTPRNDIGVKCLNDSLHRAYPNLEDRFLFVDQIWNIYWVMTRGCAPNSNISPNNVFYGPYKIDSHLSNKPNLDASFCNDNNLLVYYTLKEAVQEPDEVCALNPKYDKIGNISGPDLVKLFRLKYLYLSNYLLNELPPEIGKLANLEEIYLVYNNLQTIPAEIIQLKRLKVLDLTGNKISPAEQVKIKNMLPGVKVILDRQRDLNGNYQ